MAATPSIQSSAPTFSLATLRTVLAELTEQYPDREWRLVKAANIVAVRNMERYPHGGIWFVQSESHRRPHRERRHVRLPGLPAPWRPV
jgi:hypothetical protein